MSETPKGFRAVRISNWAFALIFCAINGFAQGPVQGSAVSAKTMLAIVQAEDERRWDNTLSILLSAPEAVVRQRAALAASRIGDESAVPLLAELLAKDQSEEVRQIAAFALGEIESVKGADQLISVLSKEQSSSVRARTIEALGKIAASLPAEQEKRKLELNAVILQALKVAAPQSPANDSQTVFLGLTAALRARVADSGPTIAQFLSSSDPDVRAAAANALARLRLKAGTEKLRDLLTKDSDPIVRGNAARALGAAEDKEAFEALLDRAVNDVDLRVRVSAIRALPSLKDTHIAPLLKRASSLSELNLPKRPSEANEILEIATALGRIFQATNNAEALTWLKKVRPGFGYAAPELELAFARISPGAYLQGLGAELTTQKRLPWKATASLAQGIAEVTSVPETQKDRSTLVSQAEALLRSMLDSLSVKDRTVVHSEYAVPDVLRSLARFKPKDLGTVLRNQLGMSDVIIRATAAELLGELPPDELNAQALAAALPVALRDELNDAALSILDSLAKQKTEAANEAIKTALDSSDHLIRRRAVASLKANGAGDYSSRIGIVRTRNTRVDYLRALARAGKITQATVTTNKGPFVIEFLADQAPLTVDNFVQLAKKKYFNGQTIPRVVSNFVVQAGDPRGDQNGGPGYTIRCEINEAPYERAAVGMALSGKDTGGSQWFVTHSPQPHLDGGYTVFGRVVSGMAVVDSIVRGDIIHSVTIIERSPTKSGKPI